MGGERQEEDVDVEAEVGRRDVGMIHKDQEAKREADEYLISKLIQEFLECM